MIQTKTSNVVVPVVDFQTFICHMNKRIKSGEKRHRQLNNNSNNNTNEYVKKLRKKLVKSQDTQIELKNAVEVDICDKILFKHLFSKHSKSDSLKSSIMDMLVFIENEKEQSVEIDIEESPNLLKALVILMKQEMRILKTKVSVLDAEKSILKQQALENKTDRDMFRDELKKQTEKYDMRVETLSKEYASSSIATEKLKKENQDLQDKLVQVYKQLKEAKEEALDAANKYAGIFQTRQNNAREFANQTINTAWSTMCDEMAETIGKHEIHGRYKGTGPCHGNGCWCGEIGEFRNRLNPLIEQIRLCVNTSLC